jgi:predicted RNA binding protein YcfA (HicA-like mRNA interferase family)
LPDLLVIRPKRLVSALKRLVFYEVRQTGSHLQLKRGNLLVTLPMHSGDINPFVLKSILRQARLSVEELKESF